MAGLSTDYIIRYLSDTKDAIAGAKALDQFNQTIADSIGQKYANLTQIIGTNFGKISGQKVNINGQEAVQTIQEFTTVAKNAEGRFFELNGQLVNVGDSTNVILNPAMKETTNQFVKGSIETVKSGKAFSNLADNVKQLAARAILTIPIWIALRSVVTGAFSAITESFQTLANESLALQKVKNTLTGTTEEITKNFKAITSETKSLAIESGVSQEKIIAVFQKFSSIGLDFATAMTATNAAVKLSVITQSDAIVASEGFSHALSVLVDKNATVGEKQKEINTIIALTSELWKTNGFNVDEFAGSLEKFAVTAKSVNFTTNQTLALLATLSKSGLGSAGNLLRNSIGQLLVNIDKLAADLGVQVNPALDDTFTVLVKVLGQIDKLQKTGNFTGLQNAKDALKDIFGGTRSSVPITALADLFDVLKKNVALTGDINKFNDSFKSTESILGNLVNRFHVANSEIGKAFITGIIGGEDFNASLAKIVKTLDNMITNAENVGNSLRHAIPILPVLDDWKKAIQENNQSINELGDSIANGLQGKLNSVDFNSLINKLEGMRKGIGTEISQFGISDEDVQKRIASARRLSDTINLIKQAGPAIEPAIADATKKQTDESERQLATKKQAKEIGKAILDDEIARLKNQGALTSEILKVQQLGNEQLGLDDKAVDKLKSKLEIERAIQEEKRLQNKLGSDSIKLFDIAQTSGVEAAKAIGDVLAGNEDFDTFVRKGGQNLEIFKKDFADIFKQQQALEFFTGNRVAGAPELRRGTSIAIQEEALRNPIPTGSELQRAQNAAEAQFNRITQIQATVPVQVNANIDISKLQEVKQNFILEVTKQLPQAGSDVNNALQQALLGKQGTNL